MLTLDQQLYDEYREIRHQYDFAESYCRWYENGGQQPNSDLLQRAATAVNRLINRGIPVSRISLYLEYSETTIYSISSRIHKCLPDDKLKEIIDKIEQWR